MKHHRHLSIPAIIMVALTVFVSCQESSDVEVLDTQLPTIEQELTQAQDLIETQIEENYSNFPENARKGNSSFDYVFTLVGFDKKENVLIYATWNDNVQGYVPVTEEEVTANVRPNTLIFWVKARGLLALNEIEFDQASNAILGAENTIELLNNRLWVTYVGSHVPENTLLKYDIVYDCAGDGLGPIRLDPKIRTL